MIKLKTFGSFTVGNDITSVQEGAWRSEKLEKLFVYLAMNRNRGVCIEDISEAIWQVEEETDNPVGIQAQKGSKRCLLWRGVHSFC